MDEHGRAWPARWCLVTQCAKCGAVFTESPILALYAHYEAHHGPIAVRVILEAA
jgi:hypothetical protein